MIESFHFLRPAWLLLLPLVAGLWWLTRKNQDPLRGWRRLIPSELLNPITVGQDSRNSWLSLLPLIAALLAALALAGPTWKPEPSPFADDPVPVVVVLKAGESMNLTDLPPTRMERAHLKITDLADQRKGQPLGLVAYAGSAHLVLPPTRDTLVVAQMAAEISPDIMPKPGDDLPAALRLAHQNLGDLGGSIVVLTDSVPESDTDALRTFRKEFRTPVHFLAIARPDTPELDTIKTAASTLDASLTPLTPDSTDIASLIKKTARTPVAVAAAGQGTRWSEAGWWLLLPIALLVLINFRRTQQEVPAQTTP
jgi:Ca-activated chloride channel family protein